MKKFTLSLLLSILLAGGYSGAAFADKHHNNGRDHQEHRDNRFDKRNNKHNENHNKGNHNKWKDSHKNHGNNNHWDKKHGPNHGPNHPNHPGWRPTPPPPPRPVPGHHHGYNIERDPRFHKMIAHAINGGTDYRVWRVSHDTYIVKYRKGRRWYTRRFYPYDNRYDAPGVININWNPMSAWTLLPSININIPLN
ncbi:MAG: hypothetical protein K2M93_01680 [Muribaculaceae bacterium]|nr:hypothetical protein [Muribaculaceae bacterium]